MKNPFYRIGISNCDIKAMGVCAIDKKDAILTAQLGLKERGYSEKDYGKIIVKREGFCDWSIGDNVIHQ